MSSSLRVLASQFVVDPSDAREAALRAKCIEQGISEDVDIYVARLRRKAAKRAADKAAALDPDACAKCDGTGRISAFSHVHEGLCFACGGTGRIA